ncbi:hypothetical protein IAU59_000885 [Kwoniella sp. CBS 9459]
MYPPPPPPPQFSRSLARNDPNSNTNNSPFDSSAPTSNRATSDLRAWASRAPVQGSDSVGSGTASDESSRTPTIDAYRNSGPDGEDGLTWVFTPPILVEHGMFKGRWLRFALAVAQEPVLGRRKTEKDRRPLGPAPIVRFRAVECRRRRSEPGDWNEEEVDPSAIEPSHLICAAELGPALSPRRDPGSKPVSADRSRPTSSSAAHDSSISRDLEGDVIMSERPTDTSEVDDLRIGDTQQDNDDDVEAVTMFEDEDRMEFMMSSARDSDGQSGPDHPVKIEHWPFDGHIRRNDGGREYPADITDGDIERYDSEPVARTTANPLVPSTSTELPSPPKAKRTKGEPSAAATASPSPSIKSVRNLYGNLHVAGVRVPSPEGGMGTWFLFTDLSVRHEGTYSLRFRCFDLTAIGPSVGIPSPCLVECQSQPFRVYSPRQVPPLPKPTELAEHFAKQGFKLNTRKNERTVSTPPPSAPSSSSGTRSQAQQSGSAGGSGTSHKSKKHKGKGPESHSSSAQRPSIDPIQADNTSSQGMQDSKGSTGTASTELSHDESFSTNSAIGTSSSTLSTMESVALSGASMDDVSFSGPGSARTKLDTAGSSGNIKAAAGVESGSAGAGKSKGSKAAAAGRKQSLT